MTDTQMRVHKGWRLFVKENNPDESPSLQKVLKQFGWTPEQRQKIKIFFANNDGTCYLSGKDKRAGIGIPFHGPKILLIAVACHELGHLRVCFDTRPQALNGRYFFDKTAAAAARKFLRNEFLAYEHGRDFFMQALAPQIGFYDNYAMELLRYRIAIEKNCINNLSPAETEIELAKLPHAEIIKPGSPEQEMLVRFVFRQMEHLINCFAAR